MKNVLVFTSYVSLLAMMSSCSESNFSSADRKSSDKKEQTKSKPTSTDEDEDIDEDDDVDTDKDDATKEKDKNDDETKEDVTLEEDVSCILKAQGEQRTTINLGGENCINNGVDPGGADFDDYHLKLTGDFLLSGWNIFSNKNQDISIQYNLGSPGSTTQVVAMTIVDCQKERQESFEVSSGSGTKTLSARKGDRFNIIMTVTSGCYGRKDVYDLIKDGSKAFRIR